MPERQDRQARLLAGLSKVAEFADVSVDEVAVKILEDFVENLNGDPALLVTSDVSRGLLTTRLFSTQAQALAAASRYNALVDRFENYPTYDGARARVIEASSAAQAVAGYWVELN